MNKRRDILIRLACAIVLGGIVWALWPGEPSYGGKKLSEWVELLAQGPSSPKFSSATDAIRAIGTDANPYLLRWIRYEELPLAYRKTLMGLYSKLPRRWQSDRIQHSLVYSVVFGDPIGLHANYRLVGAAKAFRILGPDAKGAIPELERIVANPRTSEISASWALSAIKDLDPATALPFMGALTNKYLLVRARAAYELLQMGAAPGIPVLSNALHSPGMVASTRGRGYLWTLEHRTLAGEMGQ